ncbi:MAG: alpha/beta fold hydrolase [Chloroflexota bacterium]
MKKKFALTVIVTTIVLVGIVATGFWYLMGQPMYRPGMVREGKNIRYPLTPPAQTGDADYWQVESDVRLYHFAHGEGRNVLIVHGGPGVPFRQPLVGLAPLAGAYRFQYYDQRGSGKSTRPVDRFESPNTYENMKHLDQALGLGAQLADIERIRQILGDEKLILIGHSWGGFLASLYAAEFPERIEALILVSPATTLVMPQEEADLFDAVRTGLPQDQLAAYDAFMAEYFDFNALFSRSEADLVVMNARFGEYYLPVAGIEPGELVARGEPGGWMSWGMYVSMGQRHDYRPALEAVTAPVLVIHGEEDLQSEAASRQYADLFPNAQFVVIEDTGHFSFEQQPEKFAEVVAAFLGVK